MTEHKSRVETLARNLRRAATVLFALFLVSCVAAIAWVQDEFVDASLWRYLTAIADVGSFLIASVVAWVGSALVTAVGRVRGSVLAAMHEPVDGEPRESAHFC